MASPLRQVACPECGSKTEAIARAHRPVALAGTDVRGASSQAGLRMDWVETMNAVEKLGVKTFIAGHTDPAAPDNDAARLIEATRQYI
jgi:hypothetical protein